MPVAISLILYSQLLARCMLLVFLYPIFLILYSLITVVDDPATDSQLADLQLQLITLEKVRRLAPIFLKVVTCFSVTLWMVKTV